MLEKLLTEQQNPASVGIDALSTKEILEIISTEDQKVAGAVATQIPAIAKAVDAIVESIRREGRLFYIGAGSSGRLGVLDAAECPPTFNVSPEIVTAIMAGGNEAVVQAAEYCEDEAVEGARDLMRHSFKASDVLVGIAASGRTPYVLGAVRAARGIGAVTVGISCTPDSALAQDVQIAITPLTGPEVITGSTRMKAATATKLVLNMLSTATMIRLGYVFSNLMVNVKPTSSKLLDRAQRIVSQAAGVDEERATGLLEAARGSVKTAILMGRRGTSREEAERQIEAAGGSLSQALKE